MADIDQQRARQDYERGQLAVDVYRPEGERGVEGWRSTTSGDDITTGLKAQAYKSLESDEIVIAFGGTDSDQWGEFWKDLKADTGFISWHLPDQIKVGLDFCAQVIDAEVKSGYSQGISQEEVLENISLSGHSLGGGIAQLAGYVFGLSGTTMEAPGVGDICESDSFGSYVQDLRARYPHLVQEELGEGKKDDFRCFTEDGSGVSWAGGDHHGKEIEMDNVADLPPWLMTAVMVMTGGTSEAARVLALWIAGDNAFLDQHDKETMLKALAERCGCDTDAIEAPDDEAASDDGDSAPIHGEYIWQPGDELEALAKNINGVKAADIADYNGLDAEAELAPDDVIYVPDFVELQQFRAEESAESLAEDMQVLMVEAKVFFQHQLSLLSTEMEELREQLNGEDLTAELKEQMQQQMEELKQLYQDAVEQLQDKISKYLDDLQELPERLQQELSDFKDQLLEYKEQFANLDETWSEALEDLSAALDEGVEWDTLMYYALDELGKEIDIPLSVDFGLDSEGGDILNQVVSTELHNIAESGWESMVEGTEFSYDLNMMELGTMAAAAIGGYYGTQDGMGFYEGWSGNAIDTREEAAGAMIGGAIGADIGAGIGTAALPIVGTVVGAYVGSYIGAAAGAFLGSFLGDEPPVPSANARYVYDAESGEYKLESSGANETGSVEAVRQIGEALGTGVVAISTMSGSQVAGAYPDIVVFQSGDKWMMNGIVSSDPTTAIERAMIEISQGIEYEGGSDYIRRAFYESDAANVVDLQADLAYATNYQRYQQGGAPVFLVNSDFAEAEDGERAELLAGDALSSAQTKLYIAYNQLLGESSVNSEDAEQVADALRQNLELADDSSYGDVVAALRENLMAQLQEQMGQLPAEERQATQAEIDALAALGDAEAMAAWAAGVESVSFREYVDMKIAAGEGADYQQMIERATSMGVDQEHYSDYFSKLGRLAGSAGVVLSRCTMDDLSFRLDGEVLTIKVASANGDKEFALDFCADGDFDWLTSRLPLGNNMYSLAGIVQTLQLEDGQELSGKDYLDAAFAGIAADADGERIAMTAGDDDYTGSGYRDLLIGGAGNDTINSGGGDDYIDASGGSDVIDAGEGTDTVSYANAKGGVSVNLHQGLAAETDGTAGAEDEDAQIEALDKLVNVENVVGSAYGDTLVGDAGANELDGAAGDDFIRAGAGDDVLIGGAGDDQLFGETGNDELRGGSGDDVLLGGEGDDVLLGGSGADRLLGGVGADVIAGGEGEDTVSYSDSTAGVEVVLDKGDGSGFGRGGEAEGDRLTGVENIDGSAFADVLTGSAAANQLRAGAGDDTVAGGAGDDILQGEAGDDKLFGGQGDDSLLGGLGDDLIFGGQGNDYIYGGIGADVLDGGDGDDFLYAGAGDDRVFGGAGFDTLALDGNLADYDFFNWRDEGLLIKNKATDEIDLITGVEAFKFADKRLSLAELEQQLQELADADDSRDAEIDSYGNPGNVNSTVYRAAQLSAVAMATVYAGILSAHTNDGTTGEVGYFSDENTGEINPLLLEAVQENWGLEVDLPEADGTDTNSGASSDSGGSADDIAEPVDTINAGTVVDASNSEAEAEDGRSDGNSSSETEIDEAGASGGAAGNTASDDSQQVASDTEGATESVSDDTETLDAGDDQDRGQIDDTGQDDGSDAGISDEDIFNAPSVSVLPSTVEEDGEVALSVQVQPGNAGSDISIYLTIPDGAVLNHGSLQADGRWKLELNDLHDLHLTPSQDDDSDFVVGVEVLEFSTGGLSNMSTDSIAVEVNAVADAPELAVSAAVGNEDGAIALDVGSSLVDVDGSESLQVYLEGVPGDASLSAGVLLDDGRWLLNPDELADLQLLPGVNNSDDFVLTVRALASEGENGSQAETVLELPVTVNAVADVPELAVSAAVGAEDSAIALDVASNLVDADGSETLQVYLEGVPSDASLSAGRLLDDGRWLLNSDELAGLQLLPGINNSDDFVLTVRALASEGENSSQAETVLELPVSVNAVADAPDLAVSAAVGNEDSAIALDVASSLVDVDGSESLQVYLEGVPADASLSAGVLLDDGRWLLSSDELAGLQLTPGINNSNDFVLTVRAVSGEGENGSQAETVLELPVTINAVADAPELAVSAAVGAEDSAIALDVASNLVDADGSESLQIYLEGMPADASLSAGVMLDDGRWLLSSEDLAGLQLTPGINNSDDFVLTVRAVSSEVENGSQAETVLELPVTVNAVADAPELAVSAAVGNEDGAIALDISSSLVDTDLSESLSIYIDNVPAGARLSAGALLDDGRWVLAPEELEGLHLQPAANDDSDLLLEVRAVSIESENGDLAETVAMLPVTVRAVADSPELEVDSASGSEDKAIALDISTTLVDGDVSEQAYVYIESVPEGAFLNRGSEVEAGVWRLTPDQLDGLTITPAANDDNDFDLVVRSVSVESANGDSAESISSLRVEVAAVADTPALEVAALVANEDQSLPLTIDASALDTDGSESLKIYVSGLFPGAALSAGLLLDDGRWLLNEDDLDSLHLYLPDHYSGDLDLEVKAVSTEFANGSSAETVLDLPVTVNAVADAPELAVSAAVGSEDSAIALDIASSLVDVDGSEILQVYLEGVPGDASLSAGVLLDDGRWLLSSDELAGLQLTPGINNSDDFVLTVRAVSSEGENHSSSETVLELPVTVNAIADAPDLAVSAAVGNEDSAIALDIASNLVDADGSESLQVYLEGVPADASLSAGRLLDDGRWLLNSDELAGLQLMPGVNNSDDFVLTVRAVSSEGENHSSSETVLELPVTINAVADAPDLAVSAAVGAEDSAIALDIASGLVDVDGSESLQVYLEGVPGDASLSAGVLLDDGRWLLNSDELAGLQLLPGINNSDDFVLTVRALASEGENSSQAETVLELPVTVNAVADAPDLAVSAAVGNEDSAIALDIASALVDVDGSETLQVYLEGVPGDASLSAGTLLDDGRWLLSSDELAGLQLTPGINNSNDFVLTVRALASEDENSSQVETVLELPVTVNAVADAPDLAVSAAIGNEDSAIALDIASNLVDADGSENLQIYLEGVPADASLSAGVMLDDGRWLLSSDELAGLQLTPGINNSDNFVLTVRALASEGENSSQAETVLELPVTVNAVADAPDLAVSAAVSNEDSAIALDIASALVDVDDSETLQVYLEGVPSDASLSAGELLDDGRWLLSAEDLAGLQLSPGKHNGDDFTLTVRALSREGENDSVAEMVAELPVTINAVADAPDLAVSAAVGAEDSAIALDVASSLVDIDGSETLQVYLEGVPSDASLSAGVLLDDGRWLLSPDELAGLQLTPGINNSDDFVLTVRALASEGENGSQAETVLELPVSVNAVADAPELSAMVVRGDEDTAIALDISSELKDKDGSEKLTIFIEEVPEGAYLNKGTDIGDGIWQLQASDLNDLTITPAKDSDVDFVLKVTALATESENSNGDATAKRFSVIVDPVADTPVITELSADANYSDSMQGGRINGDSNSNSLYGGGGADIIYGNGGNDIIYGDKSNNLTHTPINIGSKVTDSDGSEQVAAYVIRGVPTDSHLSLGRLLESTGEVSAWEIIIPPKVNADDYIAGLELVSPPANANRIVNLSVSSVSKDSGDFNESSQATLSIKIEAELGGNDTLYGGSGDDSISGNYGNDALYGSDGNDWLYGNSGNDKLYGGDDGDRLFGGSGNDILDGGSGTDTYYGGSGDDTLYLDTYDIDNVSAYSMQSRDFGGGSGYDTAYLTGNYGVFSLNDWQVERVSELNQYYSNTLTAQGKSDAVYIDASAGDDTVIGGDGSDVLIGGSGRDVIEGGKGNDTIYADYLDTRISGGGGVDKVIFEHVKYDPGNMGIGNFNIANAEVEEVHGTGMADNFYSSANYDTDTKVFAGGGDDRVASGKGDDVLDGGSGSDTLDLKHATGSVNVNLQSGVVSGALGNDKISNFENVMGSEHADVITGSSGSNTIEAGRGNDVLDGGRGIDTLVLTGSIKDFYYNNKSNSNLWKDIASDDTTRWLSFKSPDGSTKRVTGFEHIKFDDYELHLDGRNNDIVQVHDSSRLTAYEDRSANFSYSTFTTNRFFDFDGDRLGLSTSQGGNSRYIDRLSGNGSRVEYRAEDNLNTTGNSWDKGLISSNKSSFLYKVSDGNGSDSGWLTQEVKVNAINDAPVVTGISSLGDNKYRLHVSDVDSRSFSNSISNVGSYYDAGGSSINMREGHDTHDYMNSLANLDFVYRTGVNRWETCKKINFGFGSFSWSCKTKSETAYRDFDVTVKDDHGASDTVRFSGRHKSIRAAPIALDLDDDGNIAYVSESSSGQSWFDLNDDGIGDLSAWVAAEDGFLAIDIDGNGVIEQREELVLAAWGELAIAEQDLRMDFNGDGVVDLIDFDADANGVLSDLEGLRYFDSNQDGIINGDDEAWEQFGVWQDADSDGICDAGEFRDLDNEGITSIGLSSDGEERSEAGGDAIIYGEGSYTRSDGSTGITHDAALRFSASEPDAEQSQSAEAGYPDAAEVHADDALDYSHAQIAADLALLRSGAEVTVNECEHGAEAMAQMAEQARAIVAAGKVEVLEDAAADLSSRPAVEPELAKACVIAAGYLAAASVNAEAADNLPANSDDASANLDLSEPENLFGF